MWREPRDSPTIVNILTYAMLTFACGPFPVAHRAVSQHRRYDCLSILYRKRLLRIWASDGNYRAPAVYTTLGWSLHFRY